MGVAFQHGTVHECAGVALVGVAAHIFLVCVVLLTELPLKTGWETRAAAAPESGIQKGLDYIVRSHLREHLAQCLVSACTYVFLNVFRIDDTAVAQGDTVLFFIKVSVNQRFDAAGWAYGLLVQKTCHHTAL